MERFELIPSPVTKKIFKKETLEYSTSGIWNIFDHLTKGGSLSQAQTDELFEFFLSIGILVIRDMHPGNPVKYSEKDGFIANDHQVDEMMDVVIKLYDNFVTDPSRVTSPKYYPNLPDTVVEERKFHNHFKNKGKLLWKDGYKKQKNEPLSRRIGQANDSFGEGESAERRRTDVHTDAMTETPDYLLTKSDTGFSLDLYKLCTSNKVFDDISEKAKDAINEIYISEYMKKMLSKAGTRKVSQIVKSVLISKGYKIQKENDEDSSFIIEGPKGSIHESRFITDAVWTSAVTICPSNDENVLNKVKALKKREKPDSNLLIIPGKKTESFKKETRKILPREVWELLDLVDIIKDEFDKLPESDQRNIKSLIEDLVTDF